MSGFVVILVVLIVIVIYVGSLWLSPWVKCSRCDGKPRRKGLIFGYALHVCTKCKGTGRQVRWGRRVIFGPPT